MFKRTLLNQLCLSALFVGGTASAFAAGIDRSAQPSAQYSQSGTFAYVGYVSIQPDISGEDANGDKVESIGNDYNFYNFGTKTDINDSLSVGIFYDQPFGADVTFKGDNYFVGPATNTANGLIVEQNLTDPMGNQISNVDDARELLAAGQQQLAQSQAQLDANRENFSAEQIAAIEQQLMEGQARLEGLDGLINVAEDISDPSPTNVELFSDSFTGVLNAKLGQDGNFQVYGGPVLQKIEGDLSIRGDAYGPISGYDVNISKDTDYGFMAGIAYTKPEIALKAALTYRSEIDHNINVFESLPAAGINGRQSTTLDLTTPKSVNLDFQTGVSPTMLLTARARWVPWSEFEVKPRLFNETIKASRNVDLPLLDYDEDAYFVEVGLGKRLAPQLAVSGSLGWDSGAGNPVSALGPVEGYYSVGLGAKYNFTPEWSLSGGAKYLMLGDAKGRSSSGAILGDFEDNDTAVYGVQLQYAAK